MKDSCYIYKMVIYLSLPLWMRNQSILPLISLRPGGKTYMCYIQDGDVDVGILANIIMAPNYVCIFYVK